LRAEGNYYYDITKTGTSFHGDTDRMKVVGVRLGNTSLPIHYQWFYQNNPIGNRIILNLNPGDIYVMSQKATGNDWKKKTIYTLHHATGADKYLKIKIKKPKLNTKLIKELAKYDEETIDRIIAVVKHNKKIENDKLEKDKLKMSSVENDVIQTQISSET